MALLSFFLILTSIFINHTHSQCSNLDQNTCEQDGYCLFNANSDCVCGQTTWLQDIAFIFDSSMTDLEWRYARDFAAELLYFGTPFNTTRVAIFTTKDSSNASTIRLNLSFDEEPIQTTIDNTLPNLQQESTTEFYLQISLQNAQNLFLSQSSSNRRKILIIFAKNAFAQSPCKVNLRTHGLYTFVFFVFTVRKTA